METAPGNVDTNLEYKCPMYKKEMNFGMEIFIHIFGKQRDDTNKIYGIKHVYIGWPKFI